MLNKNQNFIPVLTSEAGSCLTAANWQEVNITCASYKLESLLLKPGYELLKKVSNLAHYLNWQGTLILNATQFTANKEGVFTLISPFDGSKTKLDYPELLKIIHQLQPDSVILPPKVLRDFPQVWTDWNHSIMPFVAVDDVLSHHIPRPYGVYFHVDDIDSLDIEQLQRWMHVPRYATGSIDLNLMRHLIAEGVEFIESDQPAQAAMQGRVLSASGAIDLNEMVTKMQCDPIDQECTCPTCSQKLTKAYLHHLYHHTPLLCQRFLIQHNVYYVQQHIVRAV